MVISDRPLTTSEAIRWIRGIILRSGLPDVSSVTAHSAKATMLSMLSKVGAPPEHRLILGHHSLKSYGSLEVYARDVQSAPLRTLCRMLQDIRKGLFCPDATASGLVFDDLSPESAGG